MDRALGRDAEGWYRRVVDVRLTDRPPSPNQSSGNWQAAAAVRAVWRDRTWIAAMGRLTALGWAQRTVIIETGSGKRKQREPRLVAEMPMAFADVDVTIIVPTKAHHDWDNGVASLKPCFDGCVDAGIVIDDSTLRIPSRRVEYRYERGMSEVRMVFREISEPGGMGL